MLNPTMSQRHRNDDVPPCCKPDTAYQDRVFRDVSQERSRIIGALIDEQEISAWRIANRMSGCSREPMVLRDYAGDEIRLAERRCRSRCCPRCRRFRAREIQYRLLAACKTMDSTRFLTLTLVSTDEPLKIQLQHLRQSFARLRRHRFWRAHVVGGIYCVEVTWSVKRRQWHPHLHAIIDGSYVRKSSLASAWKEASGGSYIVDIQYVHSASRIASYVAKYVSKSDDASGVPDAKLAEWSLAVHGLRLVHSFGNLHGVALVEKPEFARGVSIEVINPSRLAASHHTGDVVAGRILEMLDATATGLCQVEPGEILERIKLWEQWQRIESIRLAKLNPQPARPPPPQGVMFFM